jgi:hypothetical protein
LTQEIFGANQSSAARTCEFAGSDEVCEWRDE